MAKITLVDDDENIVTSVSLALESHGHTVKAYFDGATGLAALESEPPDLAILDVKMPRMDGMEVLRRLRRTSDLPVIILTSKDDEIDEILGFNLGADDYIHKPFSQRLLIERVKAVLRRAGVEGEEVNGGAAAPTADASARAIRRGKLTLDPARHDCLWDGKPVKLTVTEFLLLQSLAQRPGFVKSRDNLMDAAYDDQVYVDDRTIDSHIKRMRKKFRDVDPEFDAIETLYGVGYRYAKPDRERVRRKRSRLLPGSRLGRLIIALNVLSLAVLIAGALVLNELRRGLVNARIDSLTTQGELIATIIDQAATVGEPEPAMDPSYASQVLQLLANPKAQRARLFDAHGKLIADSDWVADRVEWRLLPPARQRDAKPGMSFSLFGKRRLNPSAAAAAHNALTEEVTQALRGQHVSGLRRGDDGERVVSVSVPIQHVKAVLGVLTLEASDVDAIIARERAALIPFILVAILVTLISSVLLNSLIAQPVLRLARAADRVRLAGARAISLPDLAGRDDELGDLTRSLEAMTHSLSERMDAIDSFAADVAHEIRNPLTSLRSAVETLDLVSDPAARDRLLKILKNDVQRLDRLVTDISNASRLDAELSRDQPKVIDLERLASDIVATYQATLKPGDVEVQLETPGGLQPIRVQGREGPLGQIFRNLIDNARSFSPPGEPVHVVLSRQRGRAMVLVKDQGPGIPPENLETIFQRFYTSRPKGAAFGGNSGLGLSIARQIAEAHGGSLQARNVVDEQGGVHGALFILNLPEVGA